MKYLTTTAIAIVLSQTCNAQGKIGNEVNSVEASTSRHRGIAQLSFSLRETSNNSGNYEIVANSALLKSVRVCDADESFQVVKGTCVATNKDAAYPISTINIKFLQNAETPYFLSDALGRFSATGAILRESGNPTGRITSVTSKLDNLNLMANESFNRELIKAVPLKVQSNKLEILPIKTDPPQITCMVDLGDRDATLMTCSIFQPFNMVSQKY